MGPLDRIRAWLSQPMVYTPIGALILIYLVYADGRLLRASALWGRRDWLAAVLAGVAFAAAGLIMAWLSIRRQATGKRGRLPGLGIAYMAAVLIAFLATHSRISGPVKDADSPVVVAILSSQIALLLGIVILLAAASFGARQRRDRATLPHDATAPVLRRRPWSKERQGGWRFWRKRR
jgi:hypothetical protein